jgi:hypothetical protein
MLFRKSDGSLVEFKRYDFKSDKAYYRKVMQSLSLRDKDNIVETKQHGQKNFKTRKLKHMQAPIFQYLNLYTLMV